MALNLWKRSAREDRAANHSEGSKRLFKDISSLKVVMDGSVRTRAVPTGYVYVRACTFCMSAEETKCSAAPPPLLSALYPPDSLMSKVPSVCQPTWLQNLPNLPCLEVIIWAEEHQGRSQPRRSEC